MKHTLSIIILVILLAGMPTASAYEYIADFTNTTTFQSEWHGVGESNSTTYYNATNGKLYGHNIYGINIWHNVSPTNKFMLDYDINISDNTTLTYLQSIVGVQTTAGGNYSASLAHVIIWDSANIPYNKFEWFNNSNSSGFSTTDLQTNIYPNKTGKYHLQITGTGTYMVYSLWKDDTNQLWYGYQASSDNISEIVVRHTSATNYISNLTFTDIINTSNINISNIHKTPRIFEVNINNDLAFIMLPYNYSISTQKLILFSHNTGGTADSFLSQIDSISMANIAMQKGYIIGSAFAGGPSWGNSTGRNSVYNLYNYIQSNFNYIEQNKIYLMGISMGGDSSFSFINDSNNISKVYKLAVQSAATNLTDTHNLPNYNTVINNAYNTTNATFEANTVGYHIENMANSGKYNSIPMYISYSTDDITINQTNNSQDLINKLIGSGGNISISINPIPTGHTFHWNTTELFNFFDAPLNNRIWIGVNNTIKNNSFVYYNTSIAGKTQVNMSILPQSDNITVIINTFNQSSDCLISINESSSNHTNTALHTITNQCWANKAISINKNSNPYSTILADNNGMIAFNYVDGYSNIEFDMQPTTTTSTSITNLIGTPQRYSISWSWTNPIDIGYNYSNIFVDSIFILNTTQTSYQITVLENTTHTISIRTVSTGGAVSSTWVNNTQTSLTNIDVYQNSQWGQTVSGNSLWSSMGTLIRTAVIISVIGIILLFISFKNTQLSWIQFISLMGAIVIIIVYFIVIPMIGYSLESGLS